MLNAAERATEAWASKTGVSANPPLNRLTMRARFSVRALVLTPSAPPSANVMELPILWSAMKFFR